MKPIYILLYEDKQSYRDSFKLIAQKHQILVESVDNVDLLLETLSENPRKHKFVVLDARAYLHEGQGPGSENEANLHKIIRDIDFIGKKQDRVIPYCINTGFAEIKLQYQEVLTCNIFEKGNEQQLINFIWESYNNTDAAKLRMDYPDLFDFADSYFDTASLEILSTLLRKKRYESKGIVERVDNLTSLRRLLEHSIDILFKYYLHEQPGIIKNRSSRASDVVNYLNSIHAIPTHVFGICINILKTASAFGSHTPEQAVDIVDYPSNNSIIGLTYGYFEIISWAKKILS